MLVNSYKIEPNANLTNAKLTSADLTSADLTGAKLTNAKLTYANLTNAKLTYADLTNAKLTNANLTHANLTYADLTDADLTNADLTYANLTNADLTYANLTSADLTSADLTDADLTNANLTNADLSQSKGLLVASKWLRQNFKFNKKGYIVYKAEGDTTYDSPLSWKNSKFITEVPNPLRTVECGCGVNFGTFEWVTNFYCLAPNKEIRIRRMYLHWEDLADVVVPYNTDGKARCARLEKGKLLQENKMDKTFIVLCDYCGKEMTVRYPPMDFVYYCDDCKDERVVADNYGVKPN